MDLSLRPLTPDLHDCFVKLMHDPAIYPAYASRGTAATYLAFPHLDPDGSFIAFDGGVPVGFVLSMYIDNSDPPFAQLLPGVLESHRRRGIGHTLLEHAASLYRDRVPLLRSGVDVASVTAPPFLRAHGFREVRTWWAMTRPLGPVPPPVWPEGVTTRTFDGSEAMLEDFRHAAHSSFAENWGFVPWTMEIARREIAAPSFRPDGLLLAYRGGAVAGFSYNTILDDGRGEVDTLGVLQHARGIGLGRALLRWGIAWLQEQRTATVDLMVDGANDSATRLYRSEGFVTAAERRTWERDAAPLP